MNPSFILLHSHQHLASLVPIVLTGVQWPSLEILILAFLISGAMFSGAYCYPWIISSRFILESYWDKVLLQGWVCLWTHFVAQDDFELLSYLNLHRAGLTDTYDHACFHFVNFQLAFNFIFSIFVFQDLFLQIMTMNHLVDPWSTIFFYSEMHPLICAQSLQVLCCM